MTKYFGTDGIRQKAEDFTPAFLRAIVKGLANYGEQTLGDNFKVLVGGDTRESSEWIIQDLCAALETLGIEYGSVGVLPTPAINYVFYEMGFDFAIDVTASHNPYTDNGIKIFERGKKSGRKLSTKGCDFIETALAAMQDYEVVSTSIREDLHEEALVIYQNHLKQYLGSADFSKLKIGMDCANGATSVINQTIFAELDTNVTTIHVNEKYSQGINNNCGSTHLADLQNLVTTNRLDFGVAFDGDGDRVMFVDHTGAIVDGDEIIAILATFLKLDSIAVTVMANQGLLNWAKDNHIKTEITAVGDQNVYEAMQNYNIPIGGEQSGHIILPGEATGDGMLTALVVAKAVSTSNKTLHDLASTMVKLPQVIVNLEVTKAEKDSFKTSTPVKSLLLDYNKKLESAHGRLLVRPSGTENLIRITMWGEDENTINELANELAKKIKEAL